MIGATSIKDHRDIAVKNEAVLISSVLSSPDLMHCVSLKPEDMISPLAKKVIAHKIRNPEADWLALTLDHPYTQDEESQIMEWGNEGLVSSPDAIKNVCGKISGFSRRTSAMRNLQATMQRIQGGEDVDKMMASLSMSMIQAGNHEYKSAAEVMDSTEERIEFVKKNGVDSIFVKTGFKSFDSAYIGLERRACHIIAGRPGMGKTAFTMQLAEQVSETQIVAVHTLEMEGESLALRSISRRSGKDIRAIRMGRIEETEDFIKTKNEYRKLNLYIDDAPVQDLRHIERSAYQLKATKGLDLMIVDYLGLMSSHDPDGTNKDIHVMLGEITKGLRRLAKELGFALIILSQLNRGLESRVDKRPNSADLRGSGEIEQDADSIMMLFRPSVYDDSEDASDFELISTKQRNGPIGSIDTIKFIPDTASFVDTKNPGNAAARSFDD